MMKLALLASLSLSLVAPSARADCASIGLTAKPVTAAGTAIPADGGIVIAAMPDPGGKLLTGDAALQHPFVLKGVNKPLARVLAPGLVVVPVPPKTTNLYDQGGTSVLAIKTTTDKVAVPAAPMVKDISFVNRRSRHGSERVFVIIDKLPAGTLAIVVSDPKGKPKSWGLAKPAANGEIAVFDSGDCQALPNGTTPSKAGDQVTLQYVDAYGRLSSPTKPLKIADAQAKP